MRKFLFLLLVFVSILKVEGSSYTFIHYREYYNDINIERTFTPKQQSTKFSLLYITFTKHYYKSYDETNIIHRINKFSLLFFNLYIINKLKINRYFYIRRLSFAKFQQINTFPQSDKADPLSLS